MPKRAEDLIGHGPGLGDGGKGNKRGHEANAFAGDH